MLQTWFGHNLKKAQIPFSFWSICKCLEARIPQSIFYLNLLVSPLPENGVFTLFQLESRPNTMSVLIYIRVQQYSASQFEIRRWI